MGSNPVKSGLIQKCTLHSYYDKGLWTLEARGAIFQSGEAATGASRERVAGNRKDQISQGAVLICVTYNVLMNLTKRFSSKKRLVRHF